MWPPGNQRYTALVVPPEMMGMHLTSPVVHSTHRTVDLDFSAAVALFGHFGVEWDLTTVDAADAPRLAEIGYLLRSSRGDLVVRFRGDEGRQGGGRGVDGLL